MILSLLLLVLINAVRRTTLRRCAMRASGQRRPRLNAVVAAHVRPTRLRLLRDDRQERVRRLRAPARSARLGRGATATRAPTLRRLLRVDVLSGVFLARPISRAALGGSAAATLKTRARRRARRIGASRVARVRLGRCRRRRRRRRRLPRQLRRLHADGDVLPSPGAPRTVRGHDLPASFRVRAGHARRRLRAAVTLRDLLDHHCRRAVVRRGLAHRQVAVGRPRLADGTLPQIGRAPRD